MKEKYYGKEKSKYFLKGLSFFLIIALLFLSTACSGNGKAGFQSNSSTDQERVFVDSLGRKVTLPAKIERVVPSGPVAQSMIEMVAPEKLISRVDLTGSFLKGKAKDLPDTGRLVGRKASYNIKEIQRLEPDVIIDIGNDMDDLKKQLDKLQDTGGIPTIFIEGDMENTASAFRLLGELFDKEEQGEALAKFTEEALAFAKGGKSKVKEKKVVYQTNTTDARGSDVEGNFRTEILDLIGAENPVKPNVTGKDTQMYVAMTEIQKWNPDIVFTSTWEGQHRVYTEEPWKEVKAVKEKEVHYIPQNPYNWVSQPPGANRLIGIYWMANIVYPDVYQVDIKEKTKEWYKLAYHWDLTEEDYESLFNNPLQSEAN